MTQKDNFSYENGVGVPTHGQWDYNDDEKAARGGLRHSTVKGCIGQTAPPDDAQDRTNPIDLEEGEGVDAEGEAYYRQDATNRAYEQTMRVEGRDKFKENTEGQTRVDQSPHHFNALVEALPKVSKEIRETLKEAKRSKGRVPDWVLELSTLDTDVMAYIGLLCCFNESLKEDSNTVTVVTQAIGQHIEQELLKVELKAEDKEKHRRDVELAAAAGLERPKPQNTNKRLVEQVTKAPTTSTP